MFKIEKGRVFFNVKVQPNSSINKIVGKYDDTSIKINVKAPAVEGAANKELIKFLSKQFKVAKKEIIIKGETSKRKQLSLPLNERVQKFIEEFS